MNVARELRSFASIVRHRWSPAKEVAALRAIRRRAEQVPPRTPGILRVLDIDLEYVDALSLAPQWDDVFVRRSLEVEIATETPRIVDCGANVGIAALWYRRSFPHARITAFEADPVIYDTLKRNLSRNGCGDVEAVNAAVWTEAGTVEFDAEGTDAGAVRAVAGVPQGRIVNVPALRLRDFIAAEPVDLLKLDIEGAEGPVLHDLAPVLDRVGAIQMEVHEFDPRRRTLPECLGLLSAAGFLYALDDLVPATWRREGRPLGPFTAAIPVWVILVRAWRA